MKYKNYFIKLLSIVLFNILIPFSFSYENQNYFCNNKIYSDYINISNEQINNLCYEISKDDRFILLITDRIKYDNDYSYNNFSNYFFNSHCIYNSIKCIYNVGINIYIKDEKVIIIYGNKINEFFKSQKDDFINLIIQNLKKRELFNGILKTINLFKNIYPYFNSNDNNYINDNYSNYNTNYNSNSGISKLDIFLFIICIIIVIYLCYLFYPKKNDRKKSIKEKDNYDEIHNHLCQLENLIKEIRKSSPPIISINKCIICMKEITFIRNENSINSNYHNNSNIQYIEMTNLSNNDNDIKYQINNYNNQNETKDNLNTRFSCQHVYHTSCLNLHKLTYCLMCINSNTLNNINIDGKKIISNTHNNQVIDETHIKTFIQNLNLIYNQISLTNYAKNYPTEFDTFNTTLLLNLTTCWGISILNPITYQVNNFNYYYDNNNNNNYIDNINDNIIDYYQPPNFEEFSGNITARFGNSIIQQSDNNINFDEGDYNNINHRNSGDDDFNNNNNKNN